MAEQKIDELKISEEEANAVRISNSADRPNAFSSYRESKKTAADVKKMFDAPFELLREKHDKTVDELRKYNAAETAREEAETERANAEQERKTAETARDDKIDEIYEAYKSGQLKGDKGDKGDPGFVNVVQTPGDSETDAMSQKASSNAFSNALKGSASGMSPLVLPDDASPYPHTIKVKASGGSKVIRYGKNLLKYPYTDASKTLNGVTFTVNEDGTVLVNGTATAKTTFLLYSGDTQLISDTEADLFLSGCPEGGSTSTYYIVDSWTGIYEVGEGRILTKGTNRTRVVGIGVESGVTMNNVLFKPQIEVGTVKTAFEPYVEPMESAVVDGMAEVTSAYYTTKIVSDTEGVTLEAIYNRDINKAYDDIMSQKVDVYDLDEKVGFERGKNLLYLGACEEGKILWENGDTYEIQGSNNLVTDYIAVAPSSTISFRYGNVICQYDKNKKFIAGTYVSVGNTQHTLTLTDSTYYIRHYSSRNIMAANQIEYGASSTPAVAHTPPTLETPDGGPVAAGYVLNPLLDFKVDVGGKNRFDKARVVQGKTLNYDGEILDDESCALSDFISIESSLVVFTKVTAVAGYDKFRNLIPSACQTIPSDNFALLFIEDVKYLRVSLLMENLDTCQVEYGNTATEYEECYYSLFVGENKVYDFVGNGGEVVVDKLHLDNYKKIVDRENYQIWEGSILEDKGNIMALYKSIAVRYERRSVHRLHISTNGIDGDYDTVVPFNVDNFPNLMAGSYISSVLILPWTRNLTYRQNAPEWRMVVITNLGQVYHNFPSRATDGDGAEVEGDMTRFDESVIWDLPERKYPSNDTAASGVERYTPGLPAERYNYYPALNADNGYGNGGFGKSITKDGVTYPRFYRGSNTSDTNPLYFMGGYEADSKVSVIGTYTPTVDDDYRTCVFATDDGGRSWYCKYDFARTKAYIKLSTPIDTSALSDSYVSGSYSVCKRSWIAPSESDKEPANLFELGNPITVSSITKGEKTVITTSAAHGLSDKDMVVFKTLSGANSGFAWLLNDSASAVSGGNGVVFTVKVLTDTTFEIYEYIASAFNNIPCRHIHSINRVKDGYIIGTGETYPEGWMFYMETHHSDTFSVLRAYSDMPITRLTSTEGAIQRILGAHMFDDADSTILVGIDEAFIARDETSLPEGRTDTVTRSSTGVFRGKLVDIDDFDKYECVFEAQEVAYFFKKKADAFIFVGQRGEFAISFDDGDTWQSENIGAVAEHFRGEWNNYIVIDNFVIVLKR